MWHEMDTTASPVSAPERGRGRLVVFSDDWGRHHSSAQRLAAEWLERYDVDWIETIGTRPTRPYRADFARALEKVRSWVQPRWLGSPGAPRAGLRVHAPVMWPSFRSRAGRRFNAWRMGQTLHRVLAEGPPPRAIITTIPLVADLVEAFPRQHWIYYCVDALADWDVLDSDVLARMEVELVPRVECVVAVSDALAERMRALGPKDEPRVISHGVDVRQWRAASQAALRTVPTGRKGNAQAIFFGAIDERLDVALCKELARNIDFVAIGPTARTPRALRQCRSIRFTGPCSHADLPGRVAEADVLVLPYRADATTEVLEPLKLKEYLATDKPVVAAGLPAARAWCEALDVADSPKDFVRLTRERARTGATPAQLEARRALGAETWDSKARAFEHSFRPAHRTTVLHVRTCNGPGSGPEKTLLRSHIHAADAGFRVCLAILRDPGDAEFKALEEEARALGATLFAIDDRGPADRTVLPRLLELVDAEGAAVWHGHDAKSNLLGRLARWRRPGLALVATAHGWVHKTRRTTLYDWVDRRALRGFDRVIAVSEGIRDELHRAGIGDARVSVVRNGVEASSVRPPRPAPNTRTTLGGVGRLEPEKGFDALVEAAARLQEDGHAVRVRLFGRGSQERALRALAERRGVELDLAGFERDRARIFRSMDVFVLSSLREGTPNALLEAMAAGCPIVATRVGGVPELVRDGVEALLVEPSDSRRPRAKGLCAKELHAALARIMMDPRLAEALGARAHARALSEHDFAVRMHRVFAVYSELGSTTQP